MRKQLSLPYHAFVEVPLLLQFQAEKAKFFPFTPVDDCDLFSVLRELENAPIDLNGGVDPLKLQVLLTCLGNGEVVVNFHNVNALVGRN